MARRRLHTGVNASMLRLAAALGALAAIAIFAYAARRAASMPAAYERPATQAVRRTGAIAASSTEQRSHVAPASILASRIPGIPVRAFHASPDVFSYAHGTAQADGRFFVGMADHDGNPFATNVIVAFLDPADLAKYQIISLPGTGGIETMAYDAAHDMLYVALSRPGSLDIYGLDPKTFRISRLISTTTVSIGPKPAIATDGAYVYGVTDTDPSVAFKVRISDGSLTLDRSGHIPGGHSAAVGVFGSTTELYVADNMYDRFEELDGATLASRGSISLPAPCSPTDDMPFLPAGPQYGYVFIGCEQAPYGYRIRTSDLQATRFYLPGGSFGMFVWRGDLYNAGEDGSIDVFPGGDIGKIERYDTGTGLQINELFFDPKSRDVFFTAWWGAKGMYEARMESATSTAGGLSRS